jgi:hypothetical protein
MSTVKPKLIPKPKPMATVPPGESVTGILTRNVLMPLVLYCLVIRGVDIVSSIQTSQISGFMAFFVLLTSLYSMYSPPDNVQKLVRFGAHYWSHASNCSLVLLHLGV